jgi:hypothetical protein
MVNAEVVQRPELRFCKPAVAGSNPALGSSHTDPIQSVSQFEFSDHPTRVQVLLVCKQRVVGSNPTVGSTFLNTNRAGIRALKVRARVYYCSQNCSQLTPIREEMAPGSNTRGLVKPNGSCLKTAGHQRARIQRLRCRRVGHAYQLSTDLNLNDDVRCGPLDQNRVAIVTPGCALTFSSAA